MAQRQRLCDACRAPYLGGHGILMCRPECPQRRGLSRRRIAECLDWGLGVAGLHPASQLLAEAAERSRQRQANLEDRRRRLMAELAEVDGEIAEAGRVSTVLQEHLAAEPPPQAQV